MIKGSIYMSVTICLCFSPKAARYGFPGARLENVCPALL